MQRPNDLSAPTVLMKRRKNKYRRMRNGFNRNPCSWSRFSICDNEFPSDFLWRHIHIFHDPFAAIRSRLKVHLNPSYVQLHTVLKRMDRKFTLAVFKADFTIFAINQTVIYGL